VNHRDTVPVFWNNLAHIVFYLSAIMFSYSMCIYTMNLTRAQKLGKEKMILALAPAVIYTILLIAGVLTIEYEQLNGTWASVGPAAAVGFVIAFGYFAVGILDIFWHWKRVGTHFKKTMLPMLFTLIISILIQTQVKEFLFTGCAITVITVSFFFTLENPAAVLERKIMMDALSGLGTRSGYEHDMEEYDRQFAKDRNLTSGSFSTSSAVFPLYFFRNPLNLLLMNALAASGKSKNGPPSKTHLSTGISLHRANASATSAPILVP
jgi:hypothetical protein